MVIKTTLKVSGYKGILEPKLKLWQGDVIFVEFTLINSIVSSINDVTVEEFLPLSQLSDVKLKIVTPDGQDIIESSEIVDNRAKFKIKASEHPGTYDFQIICYDNDGCVFHLPPCKYTIAEILGE